MGRKEQGPDEEICLESEGAVGKEGGTHPAQGERAGQHTPHPEDCLPFSRYLLRNLPMG